MSRPKVKIGQVWRFYMGAECKISHFEFIEGRWRARGIFLSSPTERDGLSLMYMNNTWEPQHNKDWKLIQDVVDE